MRTGPLIVFLAGLASSPAYLVAQGETTSAIVGTVLDPSGAAVPSVAVTVINAGTGSKRGAMTDNAGRFSFPQLKPGTYSVKVEAAGFEPQTNASVFAGLGQKQTANFTLKLFVAKGEVTVSAEAPLVNPENPNTATTLNASLGGAPESRRRHDLSFAVRTRRLDEHCGQWQRLHRRNERLRQRPIQRPPGTL
jgi:hypothetical protein